MDTDRTRVLLADDEEEFLDATQKVFRRRQIDVLTATTGEAALEVLAREKVDVLVLDVKMPGMDGDEVFHLVRDLHPNLPVIMLTGHGTVPQAFEMSREGVHDYLAKPFPAETLAAKVLDAAHRARAGVGSTSAPTSSEPISVLVVDDDQDFLDSIRKVLVRRGFRVTTARCGEWAMQLLPDIDIDVVIVDVKMPGTDGLQLLEQIRIAFPDRMVILLTGHPTVDAAVAGVRLGAVEFLTKPASIDDLSAAIHRAWLQRRESVERDRLRTIDQILDEQPD